MISNVVKHFKTLIVMKVFKKFLRLKNFIYPDFSVHRNKTLTPILTFPCSCPTYTSLPAECRMVTLPGQCCQEARCTSTTVTSNPTPYIHNTPAPVPTGCVDAISNCNAYGKSSCQDPYVEWAMQNCRAYCGFCRMYEQMF